MSLLEKKLLSENIKILDKNRFQEFCKVFIQIHNSKYIGIRRHGATSDGKTRKGTPDFIKITDEGDQIALECSIQQDYWRVSRDMTRIDTWKPYKDAKKCIEKLDNLVEIILCSSQQIPTDKANVEELLIKEIKKLNSSIIVTIFSLANFEDIITNSPNLFYEPLKEYLHEAFKVLIQSKKRGLIIDLSKKYSSVLGINQIEGIVNNLGVGTSKNVDKIVLSEAQLDGVRHRLKILPSISTHIRRQYNISYLGDNLAQSVVNIYGIPKSGKTQFVSQILKDLNTIDYDVRWFNAPISEAAYVSFLDIILRDLLHNFSIEKVNDVLNGDIQLDNLRDYFIKTAFQRKRYIVVDNFENTIQISSFVKNLSIYLKFLKEFSLSNNTGIIFISNKSLMNTLLPIDREIKIPPWNEEELSFLIKVNEIKIKDDINDYCKILKIKSAGHPLIAISLAKKFVKLADLLLEKEKLTSLYDSDLSGELLKYLFDDISNNDPELKNFIIKASALIFPANIKILNYLSSKIDPKSKSMFKLLFDKLHNNILEGDEKYGYQISYIFSNLAREYLQEDERKSILSHISAYLLRFDSKKIDAVNFNNGLIYAIYSGDIDKALRVAPIFYAALSKQSLDANYIKYFLNYSGLLFESMILPGSKELIYLLHVNLFQIATLRFNIGEKDKALALIDRIIAENPFPENHILFGTMSTDFLYKNIIIWKVFSLCINKDYELALKHLDQLDIDSAKELIAQDKFDPLALVDELLQQVGYKYFPKIYLLAQIKRSLEAMENKWTEILNCFIHYGANLDIHGCTFDESIYEVSGTTEVKNIWRVFCDVSYLQLTMQKKSYFEKNMSLFENFNEISKKYNINSSNLEKLLTFQKADLFYANDRQAEAIKYYYEVLKKEESLSFDTGWCHYRIASATLNLDNAKAHFETAKKIFNDINFSFLASISKGELIIIHYLQDNYKQLISIIEELADAFYLKKDRAYNSSITLALSLATRLKCGIKKEPLPPDEKKYPEFKRGLFLSISKDVDPEAGPLAAYYIIAEDYDAIGFDEASIRTMKKAFYSVAKNDMERDMQLFIGIKLINRLMLNEHNGDDIKSIFSSIFTNDYLTQKDTTDRYIHEGVILKNEKNILEKVFYKDRFDEMLNRLEETLCNLDEERKNWWLSEIYYYRSGIDNYTPLTSLNYEEALMSNILSLKSGNAGFILLSAQRIIYHLYNYIDNIELYFSLHLGIIETLMGEYEGIEQVIKYGKNIIMWSKNMRKYPENKDIDDSLRRTTNAINRLNEYKINLDNIALIIVVYLIGDAKRPKLKPFDNFINSSKDILKKIESSLPKEDISLLRNMKIL